MGTQESTPVESYQNKIQQWKIQFPDYVKEAEYYIRLQELLFNLTAQSLNDASTILKRDYFKDKSSSNIFVTNIFLAATYRPHNCELLAELFKSICLFSDDEIGSNRNISAEIKMAFLDNIFSPLPENIYGPIFQWGHLRFVHFCIKNGSVLPFDICKKIRNYFNLYPEFVNLILFIFAFFAKEIDENDHQLFTELYDYYQNNIIYSTGQTRIRRQIHPLLIEFYNKLSEYQQNNYQLLEHVIEVGYHPDSIAYSLLIKKEIPLYLLQKIENQGKQEENEESKSDEEDDYPRVNLDIHLSKNIENMKRITPIKGNSMNKSEPSLLETVIEPSLFSQCPIMQNTEPTLLQFCAYHGINEVFNQLLSLYDTTYFHNENIQNKVPPQKVTDFAVAGGSSTIIEILNNRSKDPSSNYLNNPMTEGFVNYKGCLSVAALHHRYDMYQWLLNQHGKEIQSSFYQCTRSNNIKNLLLCFDTGVDITLPEEEDPNYIPSDDKMNKSKITKKYHMNSIMSKNKLTPVHYACIFGCNEAASLLVEQPDSDLFSPCIDDMTPFLYASQFGYISIVKMIFARTGPSVLNEHNKQKMKAIHFAAMGGHADIVSLLINQSSLIGKVHSNSHSSNNTGDNDKSKSKKGKVKFDINELTTDFSTPLHLACKNGHCEVVKTMFECCNSLQTHSGKNLSLNVNAHDTRSCTPLHLAVMNGYTNVVEVLLSHPKIDINVVNSDSQTPLIIASKNELTDIVSLLLNTPGIRKDIQDRSACTAQKYAEKSGNEALMRLFLHGSRNGKNLTESVELL